MNRRESVCFVKLTAAVAIPRLLAWKSWPQVNVWPRYPSLPLLYVHPVAATMLLLLVILRDFKEYMCPCGFICC